MTTYKLGTMRTFKTKNFTVVAEALEETDLDLSFDENNEVRAQLEDGALIAFCAHVEVFYRGESVGEDYLGGCIYKNFDDFMDHKECGKQNKKYAKEGKSARCGSYFSDMIRAAIAEARKHLAADRPYIRTNTLKKRS